MTKQTENSSESLSIEKQKTLRLLVVVGATCALGLLAMYLVFRGTREGGKGNVDLDLTKGKISLSVERPIVEQISLNKAESKEGGISFTEGKIKDSVVIDQINQLAPTSGTGFSGKNFINRELGFLLTVPHPDSWRVSVDPGGLMNPSFPVNTISSQEGAHLNVGITAIVPGTTIEQFVTLNVQQMIQAGMIQQMPVITYDLPSQTAFAVITNPMTLGQSYLKIVIKGSTNRAYVASANYNQTISSPTVIQDLVTMVSTFTLF